MPGGRGRVVSPLALKNMHIPSELLSRLSEAVLRLYAPGAPNEIPVRFLAIVRGLISCEYVCYNEFGPNHFVVVADPVISPGLNEVFAMHVDQHPSISYVRRTQSANAVKISDFLTADQWQRTDLYNEFFRKLHIEHQMAFMFTLGANEIGFAANRRRRDFSEVHRFLLQFIAPHLSQAIQNAAALDRLRQAVDAPGGGGTIIVDGEGRVLFCSPKASDCAARFFGSPVAGRLPEDLFRWLRGILENPNLDGIASGALQPLTKEGARSCLTVRLVPNHLANEHTLVLEEHARSVPYTVFEDYGLTRREAEVLNWLSQGKTNPEMAIILGISVKTVGHHVEHILAKLGVERRASAALWAQQTLRFGCI